MKYDLSKSFDRDRAALYFKKLEEQGAKINLSKHANKKSVEHNVYLHVCFSLYGITAGLNLNESKTFLKRNCGFMTYEKNGDKYLRSCADLDSKETAQLIEWIRNYASINLNCHIPTPEDYITQKFEIDREIEIHKPYL